jgi:hypothetical protein
MAIVHNLRAYGSYSPDVSFCSPNRTNAGEPNGSITPQFAGEIILDTTNNCLWKADPLPSAGLTNNCWVALTPPN